MLNTLVIRVWIPSRPWKLPGSLRASNVNSFYPHVYYPVNSTGRGNPRATADALRALGHRLRDRQLRTRGHRVRPRRRNRDPQHRCRPRRACYALAVQRNSEQVQGIAFGFSNTN